MYRLAPLFNPESVQQLFDKEEKEAIHQNHTMPASINNAVISDLMLMRIISSVIPID